jgi:hypothetical protein
MATGHPVNQRFRPALNGIAARLTKPFAAVDIVLDFVFAEALEANNSVTDPATQATFRIYNRNSTQNMVPSSTQQFEKFALHFGIRGLWQNPAPDRDSRITRDHDFACMAHDGYSFFFCHPKGINARHFAFAWIFVDVGRCYPIWNDAKTREQVPPTRAGRGQYKFGVQTQGLRRLI